MKQEESLTYRIIVGEMLTCPYATDVERLHEQMPQIETVGELRDGLPEGPAEQGIDGTGTSRLAGPDEPAQRQWPSDATAAQIEGACQWTNLTSTWLCIWIHAPHDGSDHAQDQQPQQQHQWPRETTSPASFIVQEVTKEQAN